MSLAAFRKRMHQKGQFTTSEMIAILFLIFIILLIASIVQQIREASPLQSRVRHCEGAEQCSISQQRIPAEGKNNFVAPAQPPGYLVNNDDVPFPIR